MLKDIETASKAVEQTGMSSLELSGLVLIVSLLSVTAIAYFLKKFKEIKKFFGAKKEKDGMLSDLKNSTEVKKALQNICEEYGACRASLLLLHNGTRSSGNIHIRKVSATEEATSQNCSSNILNMTDTPVAYYGDWVKALYKNELVKEDDLHGQDVPAVGQLLASTGTKEVLFIPIWPLGSDKPDGAGLVEFGENLHLREADIARIAVDFGLIYRLKQG